MCACVSNNKIIRVNSVIVNVRNSCCYNIKADSTVVIANIVFLVVNAVRLYLNSSGTKYSEKLYTIVQLCEDLHIQVWGTAATCLSINFWRSSSGTF